MKWLFSLCVLLITSDLASQTIYQKLDAAWQSFIKDAQFKYAIAGFCVLDSKSGKVVYEKNSKIGLAPASTQKILTSVAAFELLGKEYRYQTVFRTAKALHSDISNIEIVFGEINCRNKKSKKAKYFLYAVQIDTLLNFP